VGVRSTPFVVDWNSNPTKDLVLGNENGQVILYLMPKIQPMAGWNLISIPFRLANNDLETVLLSI